MDKAGFMEVRSGLSTENTALPDYQEKPDSRLFADFASVRLSHKHYWVQRDTCYFEINGSTIDVKRVDGKVHFEG
jgi:hypothetical protein